MKKYELLYTPLIGALSHISSSATTIAYAVTATANGKEGEYIKLLEEIQEAISVLVQARITKDVISTFPDIYNLIEKFGADFPDFPDLHLEKLLLQLLLRKKIIDGEIAIGTAILDENDVDHDEYIVTKLDEILEEVLFFSSYNPADANNSAAFFSLIDYPSLAAIIEDANNLNLAFLYSLLHPLDVAEISSGNQYSVTKKLTPVPNTVIIATFIKLLLVSKGARFRKVQTYDIPPTIINDGSISIATDYRQHADIINILNEYNHRKELLTKYLTLYQIIENFMYKTAIVFLESSSGGKIFSIRDFRKLYGQVNTKELEALKRLFKNTFQENVMPGSDFKSLAQGEWATAEGIITGAEIDKVLDQLGIRKSNEGPMLTHVDINTNPGNFEIYISKLVYSIRNSIVHNTETEFHLTNFTLTPAMQQLLELFLLPLLERLVFHLISIRNNHVWYANQQISLF